MCCHWMIKKMEESIFILYRLVDNNYNIQVNTWIKSQCCWEERKNQVLKDVKNKQVLRKN